MTTSLLVAPRPFTAPRPARVPGPTPATVPPVGAGAVARARTRRRELLAADVLRGVRPLRVVPVHGLSAAITAVPVWAPRG